MVSTDPPDGAIDAATAAVAEILVDSGCTVPGLEADPDTGRARSWWWPLPSASQRALVASLVPEPSPAGQAVAAARLTAAVDTLVRARLVAADVAIVGKRPGRPTVPEAWARSLTSTDPWLPASLNPEKVRALADAVEDWVRSGAVVGGRAQLCLQFREPASGGEPWTVRLLVQDRDEPSLVLPLADFWSGTSPFTQGSFEEILTSLARMARLAPELAGVLDEAEPDEVLLDDRSVLALLGDHTAALADVGIEVLLPSWWARPARLGLRAKARSAPGTGSA